MYVCGRTVFGSAHYQLTDMQRGHQKDTITIAYVHSNNNNYSVTPLLLQRLRFSFIYTVVLDLSGLPLTLSLDKCMHMFVCH